MEGISLIEGFKLKKSLKNTVFYAPKKKKEN
jgi:hypothetical protein